MIRILQHTMTISPRDQWQPSCPNSAVPRNLSSKSCWPKSALVKMPMIYFRSSNMFRYTRKVGQWPMANEKVDLLKRKLFRLPTNPFSRASCQTSGVELEDSGRARRLTPQIIPHLTFLLSSDGKKKHHQ